MGFLLVEALSLQSFKHWRIVFCSSRRQYRDYIIDLYYVKHSTMSNSKCAMPSLSCLLSFYTIPISLFFEFEDFFYFLLSLLFLCMHACIHKVQWINRRQGAKVPKKITILPENGNVGLHVCAKFHNHTYAVLNAHSIV